MVLATYSQVSMETVLLEMGTATWSSACSNEAQIIEQMKADGYHISVVNYHLNDPFSNMYANERAGYYQIQNIPYPIIGGQAIETGDYDAYVSAYHQSNNTPSSFTITATGEFSEDTLFLDLSVSKVADYESDSISLLLTMTESDIDYEWQTLSKLNHVERSMSPSSFGIPLDFSESNYLEIQAQFLFNREWNPENIDLVSFIQDDTTKEVLQCHSENITVFAPLPVHAFFQVEDTMICVHDVVNFQNHSTGDAENIQWYFNGGEPEESSDLNPMIKYEESGEFEVKLVVSNSVSSDTLFIENYIHVQEIPEISFSLLPEFCDIHVAYLLTEGEPDEGQYFGLFVDSGYFHPEAAGIGNHYINFTYQDSETLCSDTLGQEAFVDLCESVEDIGEKDTEFPLSVVKISNRHLQIKKNLSSNNEPYQVQVFDLMGRVLSPIKTIHNSNHSIDFSIPENCPLVILRCFSGIHTHTMKYEIY